MQSTETNPCELQKIKMKEAVKLSAISVVLWQRDNVSFFSAAVCVK